MNDDLGMAGSWYAATARPAPAFARLAGGADADLVVIGGGATGLACALHAAEAGMTVVLLEGGRLGWGASGRNGGQLAFGPRLDIRKVEAKVGGADARAIWEVSTEATRLVKRLIERHGIACDLKLTGHLTGAVKPGDLAEFEAEARALDTVMGYRDVTLLSASEARAAVATPYHGALVDRGGGHFHSLDYTLGLARAAAASGAVLHEHSPALGLERHSGGVTVRTAAGKVRARHAVLAGDALLHGLAPRIEARIMPVANYLVTTAPVDAAALIPSDAAVSDTRFVVNYFRRTPDNRLMFGGGERYTRTPPADIKGFVWPFLERSFPQLGGVALDHAWGGLVSVTRSRLPDIGRDGPLLWAHGYSGQGAILSTLGGALLAEAAAGDTTRLDRFAAVAPGAFPGGAALRGPLHVLGMLWYAGRDRLG